jgi:hypothetical protein
MPRQKQTKCPLCGSAYHYHSLTALCDKCQRTFEAGQKAEQQLAEGETQIVTIGWRFATTLDAERGGFERPSDRALISLLDRLGIGMDVNGDTAQHAMEHLYSGSDFTSADWPIRVPTARLEALKEFLAFVKNAISWAYNDGYNEGRDLLKAIATGEITVEQMNARRADGRKV